MGDFTLFTGLEQLLLKTGRHDFLSLCGVPEILPDIFFFHDQLHPFRIRGWRHTSRTPRSCGLALFCYDICPFATRPKIRRLQLNRNFHKYSTGERRQRSGLTDGRILEYFGALKCFYYRRHQRKANSYLPEGVVIGVGRGPGCGSC